MNDIDEKVRKIFSEEQIPPVRFDYKIKNTLDDIKTKKKSNLNILKVCIYTVCCSIILLTGVVFAKDIENYIKKLFVNSTDAIDLAVENDYVQEIDTSYTYDKNVGIKVDRLILDDLYLDISFNIKVNDEEIKTIRFKDFEIKNDNEQIVYQSKIKKAETFDKLPIYNTVTWINQPIKINDTEFADSILLGLKQEIEEFEKLYISVKSVKVTYIDDEEEIINGNWNFCTEISDEMRDSINYKYSLKENNEFVENCIGTLSTTGMIIELTVKSPIKFEDFNMDVAEEFYINNNGKQYLPEYIDFSTIGDNKLTFHFNNIGIFTENIEILEFNLGLYNSKIELVKSK